MGDGRSPKLESITMVDDDTFEIRFNDSSPPIIIEDYLGTSSSEAEGWRVVDGATVLDDTDIDTEMISDYEVRLNLSTSVSSNAVVHFGSYTDGYGNPIVRDNSTYVLPAQPFSSGIQTVFEEPVVSNPSPVDGAAVLESLGLILSSFSTMLFVVSLAALASCLASSSSSSSDLTDSSSSDFSNVSSTPSNFVCIKTITINAVKTPAFLPYKCETTNTHNNNTAFPKTVSVNSVKNVGLISSPIKDYIFFLENLKLFFL